MNRWIKLLIIITALVVAGATTSYWAGPLIQFIGVNSSLIQGVADAVQTVNCRYCRDCRMDPPPPPGALSRLARAARSSHGAGSRKRFAG